MIKKLVKRGFIMRFRKEDEFEQELYLYPKNTDLTDYDAVVHYIDMEDGQPLREFYNYKSHPTLDVYSTEPYEEPRPKESEEALAKASKFKDKFKNAFGK
jgi:hypothetical protein